MLTEEPDLMPGLEIQQTEVTYVPTPDPEMYLAPEAVEQSTGQAKQAVQGHLQLYAAAPEIRTAEVQ